MSAHALLANQEVTVAGSNLTTVAVVAVVDDGLDHLAHVVTAGRDRRHELAGLGCRAVRIILGEPAGRLVVTMIRQVREQSGHLGPCCVQITDHHGRQAALA